MALVDDPVTMTLQLCDDDGIVRRGRLHHGTDYECTGSAHFAGEHIKCVSPAHAAVPVSYDAIKMLCSACQRPWRMNAADARPQLACRCGCTTATGTVTFSSYGHGVSVGSKLEMPAARTNGWQVWTASTSA